MDHILRSLIVLIQLCGLLVSVPQQSNAQIKISHASFAHDDHESLVDLYFSVEADALTFVLSDSTYSAVVPLQMKMLTSHKSKETVLSDISQDSELYFTVRDTSAIQKDQVFLQKRSLLAAPGEYEMHADLMMQDLKPVHIMKTLRIPNFNQFEGVAISDVILASSIVDSTDHDAPFNKNGLSIFPKVDQLFDEQINQLFYYLEMYAVTDTTSKTGNYTWHAYIRDANTPDPIEDIQIHFGRVEPPLDFIAGSFDLHNLSSGSYAFHIEVIDETNVMIADQSHKFFRYNPLIVLPSENSETEGTIYEESIYAFMPSDQIDHELNLIQQITTHQELNRIKQAKSEEQRRRLLKELWDVRDLTPQTQINEFREDYIALVEYANEHFSFQRIEGWQSDRGRILLKYGRPTEKERYPYERGHHPYEIWRYNRIPDEGESEFIFADTSGFGEFKLLHSSVTGERKLHDWYQRISEQY